MSGEKINGIDVSEDRAYGEHAKKHDEHARRGVSYDIQIGGKPQMGIIRKFAEIKIDIQSRMGRPSVRGNAHGGNVEGSGNEYHQQENGKYQREWTRDAMRLWPAAAYGPIGSYKDPGAPQPDEDKAITPVRLQEATASRSTLYLRGVVEHMPKLSKELGLDSIKQIPEDDEGCKLILDGIGVDKDDVEKYGQPKPDTIAEDPYGEGETWQPPSTLSPRR